MQVPREQAQLTQAEIHLIDAYAVHFERAEEHLLDHSLMFYVTR